MTVLRVLMLATTAILAGCGNIVSTPSKNAADNPTYTMPVYMDALTVAGHKCAEVDAYSGLCIGK